jgi:manganese/zinc/iron transport system permease protein
MVYSLLDFFTDPVLRAPTVGSILMCLSSSIVGVIILLRKRSLLGETLSHASYPGIALGVAFLAGVISPLSDIFAVAVLACAFVSSWIGMWLIDFLRSRFEVKDDAALCFVLSSFFGIGVLIASKMQMTHALLYKQIQGFLYGQTATMRDIHIVVYALLFFSTLLSVSLLFRQIQIFMFDHSFGKSIGMNVKLVETIVAVLSVLAIVIGLRSVGVIMMAGMLIAPALAARQFSDCLKTTFILAGTIGAISGFLGNYLSVIIPIMISAGKLSLPTGPMILLTASFLCILSLLFASKKGLIPRILRIKRFQKNCLQENILKYFWKFSNDQGLKFEQVAKELGLSYWSLKLRIRKLVKKKWLFRDQNLFFLTPIGEKKARDIVRLHRLWELYLVHLGQAKDRVHASAEEMEHIITPELEKQLTDFLKNPTKDPHNQPIPQRGHDL